MSSRVTKSIVASTLTAAFILSGTSLASAEEVASGYCSDKDAFANFETRYKSSGLNWQVTKFWWDLDTAGDGLGSKNNVELWHYRGSRALYHWKSRDTIDPGPGSHSPSGKPSTPKGADARTRFAFAFDNNGPDDHCDGYTEWYY